VEVRRLASIFPDAATLESALDTAARAPSAKNAQPWRWHVGRDGVHLYADWDRRLGDTDADRRDVMLSCGAVLNHCAVALAALGWYPRVHRFPDPANRSHLALFELVQMPPLGSSVELANAISRRRADRRSYSAPTFPAGTLEMLHIRAARFGSELGVVPRVRWARRGGDVELRYGVASDEASDDDIGADADFAVLAVLGTPGDDDLTRLRAGETLSHLLLSAAALGLATCPLTEPLHSTRGRLALAGEVFDGEAYPQTLIRVGAAPVGGDPLVPVERRSVDETTSWDHSVKQR
jgi:nitroreductase